MGGTNVLSAEEVSGAGTIDWAIEDYPEIITRDDISPDIEAPTGSLDVTGINGIGQMIVSNGGGRVGLCTGTLINPRTVIFAAHCVNTRPAEAYGADTGGTPIGFGFEDNVRPGAITWITNGFNTVESQAFYNVENVWYDPRSLNGGFLQADIAIATLDTPAFDIPTWAMLFTPLDQQEHVTVTGYGGRGTNSLGNQGIDFRRRIAENFVSFLGSRRDINTFLFGSSSTFEQNLYFTTFSDPSGTYNPGSGQFDFGIFGDDDIALTFEGTTAGGDSGGPLILDQKYDRNVLLGVLSGGTRFFAAQGFDQYGTLSFYQPLHAYWQVIVANNPYVYATTQEGNGQWTDPDHWIQAMDPNYLVGLDGKLLNRLPDAPGGENTGNGAKFGDVCFLTTCTEFEQDPLVGATGDEFFVQGGPGTENFVPNNVTADPTQGIRPRYFDVTLSQGATTLSDAAITIDRLTLDGPAYLSVASDASLTSLGDFTQFSGWTNVDGRLDTGEAFLLTGFLSGTGTFRTPFLTSVAGTVSPGGLNDLGTLTVDGNVILASGSTLFINASRNGADLFAVTGTLSLSDPNDASAPGATLVFNKPRRGPAPRFGQQFTIALAGDGISGTFGTIASTQGVLRPELTYNANSITVDLRAGSLANMVSNGSRSAQAFGEALDTLRTGSYGSLWNLYGSIDWMDGASLTAALDGLAPRTTGFSQQLQERQSRALFGTVTDRLSVMGGASDGVLSITGTPGMAFIQPGTAEYQTASYGFAGLTPGSTKAQSLPEGFAGFVTGGVTTAANAAGANGTDGARSQYFGMGLEHALSDAFTFGVAVGYADGLNQGGGDEARSTMSQMAAYGSYKLGGGIYAGFAGNLEQVSIDTHRLGFAGEAGLLAMSGAQDATRMTAMVESGVNFDVTNGLTLTPRAQLSYNQNTLSGMSEQGGETALSFDRVTTDRADMRLGAKFAGSEPIGKGWTISPHIEADYVRILGGANTGDDGTLCGRRRCRDIPAVGGWRQQLGRTEGWHQCRERHREIWCRL